MKCALLDTSRIAFHLIRRQIFLEWFSIHNIAQKKSPRSCVILCLKNNSRINWFGCHLLYHTQFEKLLWNYVCWEIWKKREKKWVREVMCIILFWWNDFHKIIRLTALLGDCIVKKAAGLSLPPTGLNYSWSCRIQDGQSWQRLPTPSPKYFSAIFQIQDFPETSFLSKSSCLTAYFLRSALPDERMFRFRPKSPSW